MSELVHFFGDSLIELIRFRAQKQPESLAYKHLKEKHNQVEEISYGRLSERVFSLAAGLQQYGVKGERLLLMYPSGLNYLVAYLATICAGAIAVPVYEARQSSHNERLMGILRDARPKLLLTDMATRERTSQESIVAMTMLGARWLCTDGLDVTLGIASDDWNPVALGQQDVVFLQYTSGSTGDPKGVMITNGNLLHNSSMIKRAIQPHGQSLNLSWLPPYHDMGLIGSLLQPLYSGFPCVFMSPITAIQRPIRWLEAIQDHRATISGGPNFMYEACVNRIREDRLEDLDLSGWEIAFNGAEPIQESTLRRFTKRFAPCGFRASAHLPCYGMAETTLYVSSARAFSGAVVNSYKKNELHNGNAEPVGSEVGRELVSSGNVFEDEMTVKIVDPETNRPCPQRRIGEIWISGQSVASGYWGRETKLGEDFCGVLEGDPSSRYFRTGDLGFFAGAELYIAGRLKDVIIVHGKNHYPQDIEYSVANAHPELRPDSSAAFSVEREGGEQLVVLQELNILVSESQRDVIADEIRAAITANHEIYLSDLCFIRPGKLPRTTSGKIRRRFARQMYLEQLQSD